ncbi:ROK family protein [Verminephrobacter aporrectodeae]|uniref:ROK family protein n=1 Tax=Verminephrobacter aporrectodeae TaxID=1110389 RepID=UPI002238C430|nr:ROK family protein [Verminephrobacter aporrectodeae]
MPNAEHPPALALDIGGSKTMVALVRGASVQDVRTQPTAQGVNPAQWIRQAAEMAAPWRGEFGLVAAAVTGLVSQGVWSPLNPKTLQFPEFFPLQQALIEQFACPATAMNDAQAAAWGEYRFGAGKNSDMVFLTVSTGIGGGIVLQGRLHQGRHGVAGHFGVSAATCDAGQETVRLEDTLSGRWMAEQAASLGHGAMDAQQVFASAHAGAPWAQNLVRTSAHRFAALCSHIQLVLAPDCIVLGGGIGLAPGYLQCVQEYLVRTSDALRPHLVAASLGSHAGAIGASDFATHFQHQP